MRREALVVLTLTACFPVLSGAARAEAAEARRTITVSATREVTPAADRARVSLAVERTAPSAQAAADEVARASERVIVALERLSTEGSSLSTKRYSLEPQYRLPQEKGPRPGEPRIVGYRAYNEVEIVTGKLEDLGRLIDSAVASGANRVAGLALELADPNPYQRQAVEEATREAARKAQAIAKALGVNLGAVVEAATEPAESPPPAPMFSALRTAASVETPVLPGTVTIRASVRLTYEISQ